MREDVEPMLQVKTALVDVPVDIPEQEIDQCCAEYTGEDERDDEVGSRHGTLWRNNVNGSRHTTRVNNTGKKARNEWK
jgi:hypothetical protein